MSQQVCLTRRSALKAAFAVCLTASLLAFAQERERVSPHQTVSVDLNGQTISITYGRPSLKGRKMLGGENPYGKVWRLGADEATKLTVSGKTIINNGLELAPGSYSLFAIPNPDRWTMIVNKVAEQWGAFKYEQSEDLGRFELKAKHLDSPVEEFTITLTKEGNNAARATFAWGDASVSTTLKVQ
jgi:hypothetical protein